MPKTPFTKLIHVAEAQENPGIIGVQLIDGTGNFLRESKRGVPTPWVAFTKFTDLYKVAPGWFGRYYAMHIHPDENGEVAVLPGAFMFMERRIYEEAHGFDEGSFMYSDDIDLSYRVQNMGYKNYYFSETSVIHYKGESTLRDGMYLKHFRQAMNFFYKKHIKVSPFFNAFMWMGIRFFSLVKLFRLRASEKKNYRPGQYILVSEDEHLKSAIEKTINKKITILPPNAFKNSKIVPRTEVIFDAGQMRNTTIINHIKKQKNKQYTFKIRPKNCRFIVGSNHRNTKGEVTVF